MIEINEGHIVFSGSPREFCEDIKGFEAGIKKYLSELLAGAWTKTEQLKTMGYESLFDNLLNKQDKRVFDVAKEHLGYLLGIVRAHRFMKNMFVGQPIDEESYVRCDIMKKRVEELDEVARFFAESWVKYIEVGFRAIPRAPQYTTMMRCIGIMLCLIKRCEDQSLLEAEALLELMRGFEWDTSTSGDVI